MEKEGRSYDAINTYDTDATMVEPESMPIVILPHRHIIKEMLRGALTVSECNRSMTTTRTHIHPCVYHTYQIDWVDRTGSPEVEAFQLPHEEDCRVHVHTLHSDASSPKLVTQYDRQSTFEPSVHLRIIYIYIYIYI
jgi:hypothetical protein